MYRRFNKITVSLAAFSLQLIQFGCGAANHAAATPAAVSFSTTSRQLFAEITAGNSADHKARVAAAAQLSFHDYFKLLHASASDAPIEVDDVILAGGRSKLEASASAFTVLDSVYSSLGEFWTDTGTDPEGLTLTEYQSGIKAAASNTHLALTVAVNSTYPTTADHSDQSSWFTMPSLFAGTSVVPIQGVPDCDVAELKSKIRTHMNAAQVASALTISQRQNSPADLSGMSVQNYTATLNLRNLDYLSHCFETSKGRPIDPSQAPFSSQSVSDWMNAAAS